MNAQSGQRLCCLFIYLFVCIRLSQVSSHHAPSVMSKCIYGYKCVSDKKSEI